MTTPSHGSPVAHRTDLEDAFRVHGEPGLKPYAPPRIERLGKLDEVAKFGGSTQNDSGSLGNQPQPGRPGPG